jgi:ribosomal protein S18 acetylase RimI-like enzyme
MADECFTEDPAGRCALVPAAQFSIAALAEAYNQTRVDYLVPMPTNPARLAEYIRVYSVNMEHSWVAVDGREILGLAMLGVRPGRTWVTRLGVLPNRRRRGTGEALVRALLEDTRALGCPLSILEVIQGNTSARDLFRKLGFREARELLVLRRPPGPPHGAPAGSAEWIEKEAALDLLRGCPTRPPWTNELESYLNAGDALGLVVRLDDGSRGWLVFRRQPQQLSHFLFHTTGGDPRALGAALAAHVYTRFPQLETSIENIPAADGHLPALLELGCVEIFRRMEMGCNL